MDETQPGEVLERGKAALLEGEKLKTLKFL